MSNLIYDPFLMARDRGEIDLETANIYCLLVDETYSPDAAHQFRSEVVGEVSGSGYTAGGIALTGKALTLDSAAHKAVWDADDVVIPDATLSPRAAVLYVKLGGPASADPLIGYWDFGSLKAVSGQPFTLRWAATGILRSGQAA